MNIKTLIRHCLIDNDALETYPFQKEEYKNTVVIRHKSNNKWFAVIFNKEKDLFINLKCPPDLIPILKEQYDAVKPGWHMNKKHWISVFVNQIPDAVLTKLIKISFDITTSKKFLKK